MASNDDPLVSTDWLAARLDDPKLRIIDASFKLPGVLPLCGRLPEGPYSRRGVLQCRRDRRPGDSLPHMYPDAKQFAHDVAELGIPPATRGGL